MAEAPRDQNHVTSSLFESSTQPGVTIPGQIIEATGRIKVDGSGGGGGTVTTLSVVTANGFAGTVANATTTPAITLTTTVTGLLKGNGTAISAASPSTDYAAFAFKTIAVSGQSDVVADSPIDTLTLVAGTNITITTDASTDTITINASGGGTTPGAPASSIQYNNAGSFGGSATLIFNGTDTITFGAEATTSNLLSKTATTSNTNGGGLFISAGQGNGSGAGGGFEGYGGAGGATGDGGSSSIIGGTGGATSGNGGNAILEAGAAATSGTGGTSIIRGGAAAGTNKSGGDVSIQPGAKTGSGTQGFLKILDPASSLNAVLNTASIASADKTYTFPNASGTFALTTGGAFALVVGTTTISSGTTTRILYDNAGVLGEYTLTGTGTVAVMQTSPTLITPVLGVATATSINGLTITATTSGVLTIANSKTLTVNDTTTIATNAITMGGGEVITFSATNALSLLTTGTTVMTFPAATDTVVTLAATQTLTNKTLTSPIIQTSPVLAAATNLKFTVPSSDPSATGITTNEFNSGYSSTAIGDLVYLDSSATWQKADADASAATYSSMLGIALSVAASAAPVNVLLQGFIYAGTPFPTFTIGAPIFMSATAGAVTQTAPVTTDSATRIIGYAVHADKMYFNPSNDWLTHA